MMVIFDSERSSTLLSFWVCEADCQSLAKMDIVIIVAVIAVVYSSSTTMMGEWLQSLSLLLLGKGEGGWGLFPPPLLWRGRMTPNAVAATARRVAGVNFEKFFSIHPNLVITFLLGNYSVESWLSQIAVFGIDTRQGSELLKVLPPYLTLVAQICACIIDGSLDWVLKHWV